MDPSLTSSYIKAPFISVKYAERNGVRVTKQQRVGERERDIPTVKRNEGEFQAQFLPQD